MEERPRKVALTSFDIDLLSLHNEMGTWGAPMSVIYVPGVRIYAQRYFSALKVLFPPVSQMPDPGVRTIRILPVSDA